MIMKIDKRNDGNSSHKSPFISLCSFIEKYSFSQSPILRGKLSKHYRSIVSTPHTPHTASICIQLLSKVFIDSDVCHNYLHTIYLFGSL